MQTSIVAHARQRRLKALERLRVLRLTETEDDRRLKRLGRPRAIARASGCRFLRGADTGHYRGTALAA